MGLHANGHHGGDQAPLRQALACLYDVQGYPVGAVDRHQQGEGHGKASAGAAAGLRNALKEFGKLIDTKLENQAHAALAAAGELEGWQRWRADQLREALVTQALTGSSPVLKLTDDKGKVYLVATGNIAFVEVGSDQNRRIGFVG